MNTFFIADLHFSDSNIIRYENRPFHSAKQMNDVLIQNWNSVVRKDDIVYVLGDFGAEQQEQTILARLNGKKYLIKGNHDNNTNHYYRKAGFTEVYDMPVIYETFWILSHEPLYINVHMPYANIFGHVHNSPLYKDYSPYHFCVSAERIDYTPISLNDIRKKISQTA